MASWQLVGWSRGLIFVIKSVKAGNKYFSNRREEDDKFYGNESPLRVAVFLVGALVNVGDSPFCLFLGMRFLGAICNTPILSVKRHFN